MKETEPCRPKADENLLTEQGSVVSLEENYAYIQVEKQSACGGCASSAGCGTSVLSNYFNSGSRGLIKVINSQNAQLGDQVQLSLDESKLVKQAFMAYGVPLIGLFVFALLFKALAATLFGLDAGQQDIAAIVGGFTGVALGWFISHKVHKPVLPEMILLSSSNQQAKEL